jgi:hypothetical protein
MQQLKRIGIQEIAALEVGKLEKSQPKAIAFFFC